MTFEKARQAVIGNHDLRAKRATWSDKQWICEADGVSKIPTDTIWNQHTKKQSENKGYMNLATYFIHCDGDYIYYGLDRLSPRDKRANDWEILDVQ